MKTRPWPIIILSIFHIIAPLGNILVNSLLAKVDILFYLRVLMAPENRVTLYVFTVVPLVGAVLIYICKKWSYMAYIALMTIPFGYSLISYMKSATIPMTIALVLFYIINMLVIGYFLLPAGGRLNLDTKQTFNVRSSSKVSSTGLKLKIFLKVALSLRLLQILLKAHFLKSFSKIPKVFCTLTARSFIKGSRLLLVTDLNSIRHRLSSHD
jgi:hypothetical protein